MRLTAIVATAFLVVSTNAQTFDERVTVEWVEVPVTVTLRDGKVVRNLTRENFALFDGGERRLIQSFEVIDFASERSSQDVSPLHPESRRKFLLLFDLSFSSPVSLGRAQDAARDFVSRGLGKRDLVAVGAMDVDRGFRFLTAFTTDRNALVAAIADPRNFMATDPLQITATLEATEAAVSAGPIDRGGDLAAEVAADFARMQSRIEREHDRGRIRKQVSLLSQVAQVLEGLAGRKHLVLLSEGFDPRLVMGRSVGEKNEQLEEDLAVTRGELWKVDSDQRFGHAGSQRQIETMAEEFKRADVLLHTVDIQGVRVQNDVRGGAVVNSNEGLFLLSNSTGGTVFRNSNDISAEFERLTRQQEVVYVLGFRAPVGKAGDFHELRVELTGVPGARAQHRGGYYTLGNESMIERSLSAAEVIINDIEQTDIALSALARAFPHPAGAHVPLIVEIRGADLVEHSLNNRATTDVLVYAFDSEGIVRDSAFQRISLDISQAGERLEDGGLRFYTALDLPSGEYDVKTLVRVAETDRKGFAKVKVSVAPPGDAIIVPPVFFQDAGSWIMVKAEGKDGKQPYPFVLNGEAFIPDPVAELRSGEPRLFALYVYNTGQDELQWDVTPEAKLVSSSHADDVTTMLFALEQVPKDSTTLDVRIRRKDSTQERRVTVPISVD